MSASILVQLSDPHVRGGQDDTGSARALAAAVDAVLALRTRPDAVLVSGDVADHGTAAEYERARELLAPLATPVHVLPGNQDDHDALREHFGCEPRYAVGWGALRPITGIPVLDAIGLPAADRAALGAAVAAAPQVRRIVAGHVHRAVVGAVGGCAVLTAPSTNLQARLEIGATRFEFRAEPPAFALHVLWAGDVASHLQPIRR